MRRPKGVSRVSSRNITAGPSREKFLAALAQYYSKAVRISLPCTRETGDRSGTKGVTIVLVSFKWKGTTEITFEGYVGATIVKGNFDFTTGKGRFSWDS